MIKQLRSTETHKNKFPSSLHRVANDVTCKSERLREEEKSHRVVAREVDIIEAAIESSGTIS